MSAHTAGSWLAQRTPHSSNQEYIVTAGRERIASVDYVGNSFTEEANARLIAAAPQMLAALKGVLLIADKRTDEFDAARAAIDKATGSSA